MINFYLSSYHENDRECANVVEVARVAYCDLFLMFDIHQVDAMLRGGRGLSDYNTKRHHTLSTTCDDFDERWA